MLKYIIWAALLCVAQFSFAQVPDSYYSRIDGLKRADLKEAVRECITTGKKTFSYKSLWGHYETTDVVPGTENQVFDYYSAEVYYFTGNGSAPSVANKEHACPQSWWGGGSNSNCYSDLFNVMPSLVQANSAKSNFPVGIVGSKVTYQNDRMKVGTSARSEYTVGNVFEPCDEYKGDFARIYFYVATMYAQAAWGSKSSVAQTVAFSKEDYPTIKNWILPLLLEWNRQDPVSEWEITRNERVYGEQNNRNPYIDYPQLAEYIWGDSISFAFDLAHAKVNGYGAYTGGPGTSTDEKEGEGTEENNDDDNQQEDLTVGTVVLTESFDDVEEGDPYNAGKMSSTWQGNDNFPTVSAAYQAGGSVKLGSGKKSGSLKSRTIEFNGGTLAVSVDVKGWSDIEGNLVIILGGVSRTITYEALLADPFETVTVKFEQVCAHPSLELSTSAKRCLLDNVKVFVPQSSTGINQPVIESRNKDSLDESPAFDLTGHRASGIQHGLQIKQGRIIFVR